MTAAIRRAPRVAALLAVAMLAAFALAAYSFHVGHQAACDSRNATASLFHDVIVIASTPDKGTNPRPLTKAQQDRLRRILTRIDQTRC